MDTEKANMSEKLSGVSVNVESYDGDEGQHSDHTKRVLSARQVQLFSIGGTIGTSIFVAIGSALVHGGPLSLLIGYAFWCSVIFCVNEGQMVCLLPIESSFNRFATRWVDRAFGAATLFNFEITAFTAVVGFWTDDVHPAVFPVAMLVAYAVLNLWSAKFFGETEFWISLMKVILITGLLIMTFFLMVGVNPQRDAFGFRFWRDPGPMAEYISTGDLGRFQGFFACVLSAGFAVAGPDMLSIIVGSDFAHNPNILPICIHVCRPARPSLPGVSSFRTVFVRLILFFVLGSLAVGIVSLWFSGFLILTQTTEQLVPYNDPILNAAISEGKPGAARSPYVAALTRLNVPVLPHIINAMILTSIFSAVNQNSSKVLDWCVNFIPTESIRIYFLQMSAAVTFFNGYYVFLNGGWVTADFIFLAVYIYVKLLRRSPFVPSSEADLFSGKKEIDEYEARLTEEPPSTRWQHPRFSSCQYNTAPAYYLGPSEYLFWGRPNSKALKSLASRFKPPPIQDALSQLLLLNLYHESHLHARFLDLVLCFFVSLSPGGINFFLYTSLYNTFRAGRVTTILHGCY
ncbi:general amino acid permease (Agp2), putative [Rhizoctonia solani AG-1 IA]|uniref:General amino acid permease (Agp2), putative n=1 Tax=Thanatephorus cucumeris (strain AG1-IA) TaxID=983506 RepID=L8X987_THACA|nr:general amino acid permease (Agp2), putative [Rhizoctonia solani AG-1 IA]